MSEGCQGWQRSLMEHNTNLIMASSWPHAGIISMHYQIQHCGPIICPI